MTDKIENLIAKGDTEEAIKLLLEVTSKYETILKNEAILISAQYQRWKSQNLLGLASEEISLRRIEAAILEISKKISDDKSDLQEKERLQYEIVIEAKFDIDDKEKIDLIINSLIFCSQDYSLKAKQIRRGSIVIKIEGTREGYEKLLVLFEEKDLEDIIGFEVKDFYELNATQTKTTIKESKRTAKIVAKEYMDNFVLRGSVLFGAIPIPGASISISSTEAIMLSKIAATYGFKTSGKAWIEIMKLILSKNGSQSVFKLLGESLQFVPMFGATISAASLSYFSKGFGEAVIAFFEEKFPNHEANVKPEIDELKKAFGEDISESQLEEYWNSY